MGRKKTDPKLKVIAGTIRPDREVANTPEFDLIDDFPEAPLHLNVDGINMWNDLGRQLVNVKVLQVVDLYSLEQLCYAWQMFRKKSKAEMEVTASEHQAMKALFSEFGMTPASRSKVAASTDKKQSNKFTGNGKHKAG